MAKTQFLDTPYVGSEVQKSIAHSTPCQLANRRPYITHAIATHKREGNPCQVAFFTAALNDLDRRLKPTSHNPILEINGKRFALTKNDFTAGICQGYYRRIKSGIHLYTDAKTLFALIRIKPNYAPQIVTAFRLKGRAHYLDSVKALAKWHLDANTLTTPQINTLVASGVATLNTNPTH